MSSQDDTVCQINDLKENFTNWTSVEVFEWIPYNHFSNVKKLSKDDFTTIKNLDYSEKYGISQNLVTKDYIMVCRDGHCEICGKEYTYTDYKWCKPCQINCLKKNFTNWSSGNEKLDDLIQEMQLKIKFVDDIVFEWIPYVQFNDIKEIGKSGFSTAIWKDGPLDVDVDKMVKSYSIRRDDIENRKIPLIYGLSQQRNILISGNEKFDDLIQEIQLNINSSYSEMFEWIPYEQFNDIKKIGKDGNTTVYSAIWNDDPLKFNCNKKIYIRQQNEKVSLKCLYNSQYNINKFLNEVKTYSANVGYYQKDIYLIYGVFQDPNTKDYIRVFKDLNNYTNRNSNNEKIDDFIQEMQLKINSNDIVFEWIPYNKFEHIKEIGEGFVTMNLAIWKDGPLYYDRNVVAQT
ncbi:hypothetical protein C1645_829105 [Glomus cerebriforme]|uniref:Protein kinase domain-containing protein n=1 Tax=Glomus cerebriforme TaxID=658196 RepID=A0A397SK29_9GLOM|nr:hypothetical protein C1645_829105 [Glomus cerebriforme]